MNRARLLGRSLRHFRAAHAGVVAGVALAAAVLTAALLVGDSVQATLRRHAEQRLGRVTAAIGPLPQPCRSALADDLQAASPGSCFAPVLATDGVASTADDRRRALDVRVLGVDARFGRLAWTVDDHAVPRAGEVHLGRHLAEHLQAHPGDRLVLRVEPPGGMPRESTLAVVAPPRPLPVRVARILDDDAFGRFGLAVEPLPPRVAVLPLDWLQAELHLDGKANLLLHGGAAALPPAELDQALRRHWQLADLGLGTRAVPGRDEVELDSDAVLLPPKVVDAVAALPQRVMGVSTWLASEIRAGDRRVPYALVTALGAASSRPAPAPTPPPWLEVLPADLQPDEIVLGQWLADDLQAAVGDTVELHAWQLLRHQELAGASRRLRVRAILPRQGLAADRELMPPFPGMTGAGSCRDWQFGVPIEKDRLRARDEQYWREHGGTPKAFVALRTGLELWGDPRAGGLTALRVAAAAAPAFTAALRDALDPGDFGLRCRDLRTAALAASAPATDFGGLFVGLSLFVLAAALLLAMLLLALSVQRRGRELGTLLALGFRPGTVRGLLLAEAAVLAGLGAGLGALAAPALALLLLVALATVWADAVAGNGVLLQVRATVLLTGAMTTAAMAWLSAWRVLARQTRQPALALLGRVAGSEALDLRPPLAAWRVAVGAAVAAVAATLAGIGTEPPLRAAAAFVAGVAALVAALAAVRVWLRHRHAFAATATWSSRALAASNVARRPARSLAAVALLASGAFLLVVVGANHRPAPGDATVRASGTGGFTLLGRASLPLLGERAPAGSGFRLVADQPPDVQVLPLRVRDGDEASCRSLERPQSPRLLGVPAHELARRGAFAFAATLRPHPLGPWALLTENGFDGFPVIGDEASVTWSLHRGLGESFDLQDDAGRPIRVCIVATLAGSVLQGSLLLDEDRFVRLFPERSGYRQFLVEAPPARAPELAARWMHDLADHGLELVATTARLQEFDAVQNTYVRIFQVLGGLGLLLGGLGLGIVLRRNLAERRGELALLLALGLRPRTVRVLLVREHLRLLGLGLAIGLGAALLTAGVQLRAAALALPLLPVTTALLAMVAVAALFVVRAAGGAVRAVHVRDLAAE